MERTRTVIVGGVPGVALVAAAALTLSLGVDPSASSQRLFAAGADGVTLSVPRDSAPGELSRDVRTFREKADAFAARARRGDGSRTERLKASAWNRDVPVRGVGTPDYARARSWTLDTGAQILSVPLRGEGLTPRSSLAVFFDAAGRVESYTETVLTRRDGESGRGQVWQNGRLVMDRVSTDGGVVSEPGQIELVASKTSLTKKFAAFKACLNDSGVAAWEVTLLSIACAAICIGSAGFACPVCVAGAAATAGSAVWLCADEAGYV